MLDSRGVLDSRTPGAAGSAGLALARRAHYGAGMKKKTLAARRLRLDHATVRDLSAVRGAFGQTFYLACNVIPWPLPDDSAACLFGNTTAMACPA